MQHENGESSQAPDPRSDADLIDAFRHGDVAALGVLYLRYRRLGLSLAYRWTGSTEGARDVLHDSFIDFLPGLPELSLRRNFRDYFRTVIRNKSVSWCRTQQRERERERERDLSTLPAPNTTTCEDRLFEQEVLSLLALLRHPEQQILRDLFLHERSIKETAEVRDLPEGTVRSRRHRALDALRRFLENPGTPRGASGD